MTSFTFMIDSLSILVPFLIGGSIASIILLIGYIKADIPCSQVYKTFRNLGNFGLVKKTLVDHIISFFHTVDKNERNKELQEKTMQVVNIHCLRLNKNYNYDDLKVKQQTLRVRATITLFVVFLINMFSLFHPLSSVGLFLSFIYMFYACYFVLIQKEMLRKEIVRLNKGILAELPLLANEMSVLIACGHHTLEDIFINYLPQADALYGDIKILLADFKNMPRHVALTEMSTRIQTGCRIDEISQFIDLLKSTSGPIMTAQSLINLSERVYKTYTETEILAKVNKKISTLTFTVIFAICVAVVLYMYPNAVDIIEGIKTLQ